MRREVTSIFHSWIENLESRDLHVFESAIDLLSYATLVKRAEGDWEKENLMSLAGVYSGKADGAVKVPAALARTLSENPKNKQDIPPS